MNSKLHWDDLRVVFAVAEAGTLAGAGRQLGLSHATVFRRLAEIERRLGARLFHRDRVGYLATAAGEETAAVARRMAEEVLTIERRLAGSDLRPSGTLRVTTTDTLLAGVFAPVFADFRRQFPEIALEVAVSNQVLSFTKREADVAVCPAAAPPESLIGRKVATIAQAVYGARDLRNTELATAEWIGPDAGMPYRQLETWMAAAGHDARCRLRIDSVLGMAAAAAAGAGLAVLPCYLGEADPRLARIGDAVPELASDLWLLTHEDLRGAARLSAFMDFAAAAARERRQLLAGG